MGLKKYAKNAVVVGTVDDVPKKLKGANEKIGIISQTTQPMKNFNEIVAALLHYGKEFKVFNTICSATSLRQDEAGQLAKQADIMIVVGGKQSANTTKLAKLCESTVMTHHVESADEINAEWLAGKNIVGVTGGASTPSEVIHEAADRISRYAQ
jgi:4-hydroxy-3-methylbut-2-enyl diphosphate reductase